MIDSRTAKMIATLDPKAAAIFMPFIEAAKEIAKKEGVEYAAISGNRTWKEQDDLYAQGRTKPGKIVTKAKGGQSNHNFGIALDFGCFKMGKYLDDGDKHEQWLADKVHKAVGSIAQSHKLEWGGSWTSIKDYPHFQVATGKTLATLRALYASVGSVL